MVISMNTHSKWDGQKIFSIALLIVSAISITVTGIVFRQSVIRIIPLYVSLVVGMLQSRASRFSYLLGGMNCIIYTIAYISLGLYAAAASALLFSCPIQLITFWRWSKRSYKHSTEFRKLSTQQWIIGGVVFAITFVIVQFVLNAASSNYPTLDNLSTLVGLAVTLLSLLSYREYSWLNPITCLISLILYFMMSLDDPAQITYLIYGINSMICIIMQYFSVRKLFAEQRETADKE